MSKGQRKLPGIRLKIINKHNILNAMIANALKARGISSNIITNYGIAICADVFLVRFKGNILTWVDFPRAKYQQILDISI